MANYIIDISVHNNYQEFSVCNSIFGNKAFLGEQPNLNRRLG